MQVETYTPGSYAARTSHSACSKPDSFPSPLPGFFISGSDVPSQKHWNRVLTPQPVTGTRFYIFLSSIRILTLLLSFPLLTQGHLVSSGKVQILKSDQQG